MPLVIKDEGDVPREGWCYFVEQTAFLTKAPNWPALYPEVLVHCRANNVNEPSLQQVVDWCCVNLSIHCFNAETRAPLINRFAQGLPSGIQPTPGCCGSKK